MDIVNRVRAAIDEDRRSTVRQLEQRLSIPATSIHRILVQQLEMARVSARWVPKLLTPEQKMGRYNTSRDLLARSQQEPDFLARIVTVDESWFHYYEPESKAQSSQWKRRDEPPPVKAAAVQSAGKRMATIFWDERGIIQIDWLPEGQTINSDYYINCLHRLKQSLKQMRRGKLSRGVLLQQENARPHTSHATSSAVRELGFEIIPHPPYSPDLAPSDYWLFGPMKQHLRGRHFADLPALASSVHQWVKSTPEHWFAEGIRKLPERWDKCVALKGEYVEKVNVE